MSLVNSFQSFGRFLRKLYKFRGKADNLSTFNVDNLILSTFVYFVFVEVAETGHTTKISANHHSNLATAKVIIFTPDPNKYLQSNA